MTRTSISVPASGPGPSVALCRGTCDAGATLPSTRMLTPLALTPAEGVAVIPTNAVVQSSSIVV